MSKKEWLFLAIGSIIGGASAFVGNWFYKKLKQGKFDKLLSKEEKKDLMEAIQEFLGKNEKSEEK